MLIAAVVGAEEPELVEEVSRMMLVLPMLVLMEQGEGERDSFGVVQDLELAFEIQNS